jgi:hypothetical protein
MEQRSSDGCVACPKSTTHPKSGAERASEDFLTEVAEAQDRNANEQHSM